MKPTETRFDEDAQQLLYEGIDELAKAVITTYGPKGRNVSIARQYQTPRVVHDGVTVAKSIEPKDPFRNMGARLMREAATKANDTAGDGTTASTLIGYRIVQEGRKAKNSGSDPMALKKGIDKASEIALQYLKSISKPIKTKAQMEQIATVSSASQEFGKIIAEAIDKVGPDGVVTVEPGNGFEVETDYKDGMELSRGYASPYFITNPDKMEGEVKDPYILLTTKKINSFEELLPFLDRLMPVSNQFVIIADEFNGNSMGGLVVNKLQSKFRCMAFIAPDFGERRKDIMEDIAILTGATLITEELGVNFEEITLDFLGRADRIWANKDLMRIVGGKGKPRHIKDRIKQLKTQIQTTKYEFDKEKLQQRVAKFTSGVAVISVGAATEPELDERKERIIDAVEATKSAREEGIVIGGGMALYRARKAVSNLLTRLEGDERVGAKIFYDVLEAPLIQLSKNAGEKEGAIISRIKEFKNDNYGYDVNDGQIKDLIAAGIIDPTKVIRSVVQNSVSAATMILTTEVLVSEMPVEEGDKNGG